MTQEERIAYYEERMNRSLQAVRQAEEAIPFLHELETYYTGLQWRKDYEAEEAGRFPTDLKRGVLSQDGIYDLLERCRELGENLLSLSGKENK